MLISCSTQKQERIIASKTKNAGGRHTLTRLFRVFFVSHWQWFAVGTLAAVLTSLSAIAYATIVGFIGDSLQYLIGKDLSENSLVWRFGVPDIGLIFWFCGAIVVAAMVRAVSWYTMTMTNNVGVQRGLVDVQDAQFASLTRGDFARLSSVASGEFVSRFINDVNSMRDAGLRVANNLTKGIVTVVGCFIAMLLVDWQLTLILLISYPLALGPIISLGESVRKRAKQAQQQTGEVTSALSEGFQSGRIVKAYGLEDYQIKRMRLGFLERANLTLKVLKDKAAVDPILEIAGGVAIAGVLAISAWRIADGGSTLGTFLSILALVGVAAPEIRALGTLNAVAQEGGAAADRVFDVLEARAEVQDEKGQKLRDPVRGEIKFENVEFAYPDGTKALNFLDFSVSPGETIAFVGPSGAGKSTIFNLLLRFFDTSSGDIKIDGHNVKDLEGAFLRQQMSLVAQDPGLFDDTVRANIALGRLGATEDKVIEAATLANAHDFIMNLPKGYDSQVGESGGNLSGGQRQRIAIARAILRGAPILLMDEATSALDAESEAKVQSAIQGFSSNRTTLIIAHRLSTVRNADRIIVLDEGRVAEFGTHDDLMKSNGVYKRLTSLQLQ